MCNMFKLTVFEFRKLLQSKSLYICSGLLAVLSAFSIYTTKLMQDGVDVADPTLCGLNNLMEALPTSMITTFLGIFIALFVCEDYTSGTIRNVLTRGFSRFSVYLSKYFAVLAATVLMSVICCAACFIAGTIIWGAGDAAFGSEQVKILLCQLVVIVAYASLFFALSSILQKTGGAIALCIVLPMVLTVVLKLADTALAEREIELSHYWLSKLIKGIGSITVEKDALKDALLYSAIYIPVSLAAGWLATMKREY